MEVNACLFDLDGVLVDSEPISTEASDIVLAEVGIRLSEDERKEVFGKRTIDNYRRHIARRGLDLDAGELVEKKNVVFARLIRGRLEALPGVLDLLAGLDDAGVSKAVVSSSPLDRVNASLEEVGLILEFDLVLSGDCCVKGKPDPEPFLLAAERLGVEASGCVVIEDAEAGVLAAKSAGMKCVAVKSPNTFGQDLSKADLIVESLADLSVESLEKLF
ncbi:MAG: HAD family phosphatase [Candidatus Altiarchaeota archaeon]